MAIRNDMNEMKEKIKPIENLPNNDRSQDTTSQELVKVHEEPANPSPGNYADTVMKDSQRSANVILAEARDNILRASESAKADVPRHMEAISHCNQLTIELNKEFGKAFIDTQEQFMNAWMPFWESTITSYYRDIMSPLRTWEIYANFLSGIINFAIFANQTIRYNMLAGMGMFRDTVQQSRKASDDLARAGANLMESAKRKSSETEQTSVPETVSEVKAKESKT